MSDVPLYLVRKALKETYLTGYARCMETDGKLPPPDVQRESDEHVDERMALLSLAASDPENTLY